MSPLGDVFFGICPQDLETGLFPVCVYACLEFKVIECVSSCDGDGPVEIGQVFAAEAIVDDASFVLSPSPPPSPPPSPGLFVEPPSCAPSDPGALLFPFPFTTPQIGALPLPFESALCNGLECPLICGIGPQVGALIASEAYSSCGDADASFPASFGSSIAPLFKDITLSGGIAVQSLQTTSGIADLTAPGFGTIEIYAYTDTYFRAPVEVAMGVFECPEDQAAGEGWMGRWLVLSLDAISCSCSCSSC